jgi:two-component sensor histidine kinase
MNNRIAVRGPDFWITSAAAQTIGMALHELATNAGKYGALSTDAGHVDIAWRLERADDDGHRFTMEWNERDGPTVTVPTRHGFGWTVLPQMTKMLLGADVALEFSPAGVVWRLACPADRVPGNTPRGALDQIAASTSAARTTRSISERTI